MLGIMPLDPAQTLGRTLVGLGLALAIVGLLLLSGARPAGFLGRLPGDFVWTRGGVRLYVPLGTCLLLSLALTAVSWLVSWLRR